MLRAIQRVRSAGGWLAVALLAAACSPVASAQTLDLSLNLMYNDPGDPSSGGTWEIVAKTDTFGIAGLDVLLTDANSGAGIGPTGEVNGGDEAGFSEFQTFFDVGNGFRTFIVGQDPIGEFDLPEGDEETVFYGVGSLANGSPNFAGVDPEANFYSVPFFDTLTNTNGIPWATGDPLGDPAWDTAARLISGTFFAGTTPAFFQDGSHNSRGNLFTELGTSTMVSVPVAVNATTTIVRSDLFGLPDYNHDGFVNAADYTVWRNTLGSDTILDADGNHNGIVDQPDYLFWRDNYGAVVGSGAGGGSTGQATVPEPATWTLLWGVICLAVRPFRRSILRIARLR